MVTKYRVKATVYTHIKYTPPSGNTSHGEARPNCHTYVLLRSTRTKNPAYTTETSVEEKA